MNPGSRVIEIHVPPEGVIEPESSLPKLVSFLQAVWVDCNPGGPGQPEIVYGDHDEREAQFIIDMIQLFNMRLVASNPVRRRDLFE